MDIYTLCYAVSISPVFLFMANIIQSLDCPGSITCGM